MDPKAENLQRTPSNPLQDTSFNVDPKAVQYRLCFPRDKVLITPNDISMLNGQLNVVSAKQAALLALTNRIDSYLHSGPLVIDLKPSELECILRDGLLIYPEEQIRGLEFKNTFNIGKYKGIKIASLVSQILECVENGKRIILQFADKKSNSNATREPIPKYKIATQQSLNEALKALLSTPAHHIELIFDSIPRKDEPSTRSSLPSATVPNDIQHKIQLNLSADETALLNCDLDGSSRYALPGRYIGKLKDYAVYYRDFPARIIHFGRNLEIQLNHAEYLFLSAAKSHVVCISITDDNLPIEAYVNLNLPPTTNTANMISWRDLELDLKFTNEENRWHGILLDLDEFEANIKDPALRSEVVREIENILDEVNLGTGLFMSPALLQTELTRLISTNSKV